jgi:ubiquinone/menaquinone biosynthesis C-methylase UbiE
MKKIKDKFSKQADAYSRFRPSYPKGIYGEILQLVSNRDRCWDCGTGNGQVAVQLSPFFKEVFATDISKSQIARAPERKNILYFIERAENTSFKENQFDLVTVAQAAHWFDMQAFNKELNQVVKNNGLVYAWGYGLLRTNSVIDTIIDEFYSEVVGPYWDKERKHIDNQYATIPFDFTEVNSKKVHIIEVQWKLDELKGYLNSWSSVQNFMAQEGENPVNEVIERIKSHWSNETFKEIKFPIFTRIGRIEK